MSIKKVGIPSGGTTGQVLTKSSNTSFDVEWGAGGGGGGSGTVTNIATTAPITGGPITTTGTIGITQATTSTDGYLSATDWNTFNNKQATGLSWLLASGGTLTGNNEIIGTSRTFQMTWNSLGTTQTDGYGIWLRNTTAASLGNQQISPSIVFEGNGWKTTATAASQSIRFAIYNLPTQGTTSASGELTFLGSINNVAYTTLMQIRANGVVTYTATGLSFTLNRNFNWTVSGADGLTLANTLNHTATSGTYANIIMTGGLAVASGTTTWTALRLNSTFNTTGTYSGTAYGIDYNPTLTSTTGLTHYAWRHTAGFVAWQSVLTPAQITSNQNDYNPTGFNNGGSPAGASILRLSSDASRDITGLVGGVSGRLLIISNVGTNDIVLKHQNTGSTAANRFIFQAASDLTLSADASVTLWYDATTSRWRRIHT